MGFNGLIARCKDRGEAMLARCAAQLCGVVDWVEHWSLGQMMICFVRLDESTRVEGSDGVSTTTEWSL